MTEDRAASLRERALAAHIEASIARESRDADQEVGLVLRAIADHRRRFGENGEPRLDGVVLSGGIGDADRVYLTLAGYRFGFYAERRSAGWTRWHVAIRCGCGRPTWSEGFADLAGLGAVLTSPDASCASCRPQPAPVDPV